MNQAKGSWKPSPHIRDHGSLLGLFTDYNGVGAWSAKAISERYKVYAGESGIIPATLDSRLYSERKRVWSYPLMDAIISLIERCDPAAIRVGIEFIEEDDFFHFGKILKSNTARALRRAPLTFDQQERIRKRIVSMLLDGNVPHEFGEYRRLLKKIGVDHLWGKLDAEVDRTNPYVMRHYRYLKQV